VTHLASYWQFFDSPDESPVVMCWRIRSHSRLADAEKGDILWLFTSGIKCKKKLDEDNLPDGDVEDNQAYLIEVFTVQCIVPEVEGQFKLLVEGARGKCVGLCPPILIDDIVRPDGHERDTPIGSLRQGAWRLRAEMAESLEERRRRESPSVYRRVLG